MKCETCNRNVIPVEGVTALFQHSYWWCTHCVDIASWSGAPRVALNSKGKLKNNLDDNDLGQDSYKNKPLNKGKPK